MPDPTSRQSELIDTLVEYLTLETVKPEFEPDMTWDNYSLDMGASQICKNIEGGDYSRVLLANNPP